MKNREIADIFAAMADLMEILGQDAFRINSYRRASRTIDDLAESVEDLHAAGKLQDVPGIGKSTCAKIEQYLQAGKVELYDELLTQVPPHLPELLTIQGLGPKTVAKLWKLADIKSLDEFRHALTADPDRLKSVGGLGDKKLKQFAEAIEFAQGAAARITLGQADQLAASLLAAIGKCKGVECAQPAGSLRRGRETIGDIDLLCQADSADAQAIIDAFAAGPDVQRVLAKGHTKGSVQLAGGVQADLRVVEAASYGAALAYFTGSKTHNVRLRELAIKKGWKLNEYGLFDGDNPLAGADEDGIYRKLGLAPTPPELREDRGEIEAAAAGTLPQLVELADIRGDLHMHTTASDGHNSIDEMIDACRARGYKYLAITDHSKTQVQAHGLDETRLLAHAAAVRAAAKKHPDMLVLAGVEVDIFKDGHLDFAADVLGELDFVIASPHSALAMGREDATARLIQAIESPHVNCIGHPSGRLVGERPGMELDIDKLARAAAANDVALEINAHYLRLDLRDTHIRAAISAGAKLIISTDSHRTKELDLIKYGLQTARRGWATKQDILNTLPQAAFKKWLEKKR